MESLRTGKIVPIKYCILVIYVVLFTDIVFEYIVKASLGIARCIHDPN